MQEEIGRSPLQVCRLKTEAALCRRKFGGRDFLHEKVLTRGCSHGIGYKRRKNAPFFAIGRIPMNHISLERYFSKLQEYVKIKITF